MNTMLKQVLDTAEQLPETDQQELAVQIEDMIIQRKVASGEMSYAKHGGMSLDEAFKDVRARLKEKYDC